MPVAILAVGGEVEQVAIDLFVVLSVAGLVAIIMQRMRLAIVPAYLIAGAVIGPNVPWGLSDQESLGQVTHLAIILLLFGIGLELDISILRRGLWRMIMAGVLSCLLTIALGFPVALSFGLSPPAALALSMAFSVSSTAVVLRIIAARRELRRRSGRLSFAILVVQDIIVLGMLAVLPLLAGWAALGQETSDAAQDGRGWVTFLADAFLMIGGATALVIAAKILLPRILRESLRGHRQEVGMLVGIASALATAVVAQAIGFSLEMGAFLAGFVLAGTPFRHQLSGQIGPLRDIFSALFFTTIGMKLDPAALIDSWAMILLAVLVLITLKALVISGVCWSVGALAANAIIVGLSLAQAGEFSLIMIQEASDLEIIPAEVVPNAIAVVVISLILTPALAEIGRRLGRAASRFGHAPWIKSLFGDTADHDPSDVDGLQHVIVGGFGPVGRRITEELEAAGISYTVIELNPDTVVEQLRHRRSMVFGDVGNARVLESAGIGHADVLVLTIPDEDAVIRACDVARRRAPKIFIAARTAMVSKGSAASDIGADHVTVDEMATAEAMCLVVRERLQPVAPVADAIESDEVLESPDASEDAK